MQMLVVGLTGGIACGKSFVSAQLQRAGIPVLDADALAKQTTERGGGATAGSSVHLGHATCCPMVRCR